MILKKKYLSFSIVILVLLSSCLDMFYDNEENLFGNYKLVHMNGTNNKGYMLCYLLEDNNYQTVIQDEVLEIKGNDTILFVRCLSQNGEELFYRIKHNNGKSFEKLLIIDKIIYNSDNKNLFNLYTSCPLS